MSVRQKAIGVAWGILTTQGYAVGAGAAVLKANPLGNAFRKTAQIFEVPDGNGEPRGLVSWDPRSNLQLEVYPSDTTIALAKTAAGTLGIAILDKFVITDADDPDIAGTYLVMEVGKTRRVGQMVTFDITLTEFAVDLSADTA